MAALDGGFGGGGGVGAPFGDGVGDFLPVGGFEIGTAKGVPFVTIGVDEGCGFFRSPARRRKAARGGGRRSGERERYGGRRVGICGGRRRGHGAG